MSNAQAIERLGELRQALKVVHMGMDGEFIGVQEQVRRETVRALLNSYVALIDDLGTDNERLRKLLEDIAADAESYVGNVNPDLRDFATSICIKATLGGQSE